MKNAFPILMLAGVLGFAACSPQTVHQDAPVPAIVGLRNSSVRFLVDNTRKLPVAGTFDWGYTIFRVRNLPEFDLSAVDQRIHAALQQKLAAKGFVKTSANPDLLVSYAVASDASLDEKTLNEAYEGAVLSPPGAGNDQESLRYRRGTLIIDIVETKTKHLLWRGAIMADVQLGVTEQEKQLRSQAVVAELLKNYPKPR
jgi:hypothetical protein